MALKFFNDFICSSGIDPNELKNALKGNVGFNFIGLQIGVCLLPLYCIVSSH